MTTSTEEHHAPAMLIRSVQRALRLLEAASAHERGLPAKVLAREVGLALGTTYHLLRTLTFEGYLKRLPDGSYVLGDRVPRLLNQKRHAGRAEQRAARPVGGRQRT